MFNMEEFRQLLKREPFVPLRIFTSNGVTYDVSHPELVAIGAKVVTVGTQFTNETDQHQTLIGISIEDITAVKPLGPKP